jgi:hypothetical protein
MASGRDVLVVLAVGLLSFTLGNLFFQLFPQFHLGRRFQIVFQTIVLSVAALLFAYSMWQNHQHSVQPSLRPIGPDEPISKIAAAAVDRFHAEFDAGRYADLCGKAEPNAIGGPGETGARYLPCPEFLSYVHGKLGAVTDPKRTRIPIIDGRAHLDLEYTTRYERGTGREYFEWRIGGASAVLTSYRILSDAIAGYH